MRASFIALPLIAAPLLVFATRQSTPPVFIEQKSNTTQRLVAVSAASPMIAWASGARGTFVHTSDGGETWIAGQVAGAERLDFRDVHAVDEKTAYLLSAGNGDQSRIYKTMDAGATWRLQFTNRDSAGFYDCFDFWSADRGIVTGDAINGELAILTTEDGGTSWKRVAPATLPPAMPKEGSFASSGTCIATQPNGKAWIGTTKSRVLRTTDWGKTWKPTLTPITSSDTTGVSSIAFRDEKNGIAFGGFGAAAGDNFLAVTADGGATWEPGTRALAQSGVFGGAFVIGALTTTVVAVGPKGLSYSRDNGKTWTQLDAHNYWGIGFAKGNRGWAVGTEGRIVRLSGF